MMRLGRSPDSKAKASKAKPTLVHKRLDKRGIPGHLQNVFVLVKQTRFMLNDRNRVGPDVAGDNVLS